MKYKLGRPSWIGPEAHSKIAWAYAFIVVSLQLLLNGVEFLVYGSSEVRCAWAGAASRNTPVSPAPIPAASGALCPSPSASELPARARMATLMVRTGNHLGNAG